MSTPTETLAAARRAVADYQRHGQMGDDRARWADFHALRAALDLLARLTAPPDEERERGIAEREAATTPGPWHKRKASTAHGCTTVVCRDTEDDDGIEPRYVRDMARNVCIDTRGVDAAFIAHARADIPYLRDQLAAARARVAEVEGERDLERNRTDEAVALADQMEDERDTLRRENERLRDLVRYQRGPLHEAGLLTDEEYAALAADSGAVARLEGYDTLRREVEGMRAQAAREDYARRKWWREYPTLPPLDVALDDKSVFHEGNGTEDDPPIRVCDLASHMAAVSMAEFARTAALGGHDGE